MPRVKGQKDKKKRKMYRTRSVLKQEQERIAEDKQCHERNKFLDEKETFCKNSGDLI
mgnify:CR=1 FL=1